MLGMITQHEGLTLGGLSVRLYDTEGNRWYSYMESVAEENVVTMCAGDGGLVCIVSTSVNKKENPLLIIVFNPLSKKWRPLSPHALRNVQPRMVQMVMDEDTKCYKVIVVGEKKRCSGHGTRLVAEVYCSEIGVWSSTKAFPDLIYGYQYKWDGWLGGSSLNETLLGPCAYDCTRNQLVEFDTFSNPCRGVRVKSYALVNNHLFVLHKELVENTANDGYVSQCRLHVISEYQYPGPNCEPNWVKLKVHRCEEFEYPANVGHYELQLYACQGFLLVKAALGETGESSVYEHELSWLYDFSTTKWQKVPAVPYPGFYEDVMFEIRWDAVS